MLKRSLIAGVLLILATGLTAASDDLWLHVFVQEDGESGETVRVNVPIAFVEQVLPLIENEHIRDGKVVIPDHAELEGIDLRGIWEAVRRRRRVRDRRGRGRERPGRQAGRDVAGQRRR